MGEPTLSMTFQDLIISVAEFLGVADYSGGSAAVPSDAHDLDVCKRRVNEGWRRFCNSNPNWNWRDREFTITFDTDGASGRTVNGEEWRYYMPDGFYGHMLSSLTYDEDTNRVELHEATEGETRRRRAFGSVTGYPTLYAFRPIADDPQRRWEVLFYPTPSSDVTVTGRCKLHPNKLIELTDRPNAGPVYDEAIEAACLAEAEKRTEDQTGLHESAFAEALVRAIAIDQKTAPRRLGNYGGTASAASRPYTGVDSYTNSDGETFNF